MSRRWPVLAAVALVALAAVIGLAIRRARPSNRPAHGGVSIAVPPVHPRKRVAAPAIPTGDRQRRVAGRVTVDGKPTAGVTVAIATVTGFGDAIPTATATTGSDGRFDFGAQDVRPVMISAALTGKVANVVSIDLRDPMLRPAPDSIEIALRDCRARVYGTVVDVGGGAIAGAQVKLGAIATVTADDGAFDVCVPVGGSSLTISADGYGTVVGSGLVYSPVRREIRLSPEGVITGRAVRDDGTPIAGAVVSLHAAEASGVEYRPRGASAQVITDPDGRFHFAGVATGRRRLTATADGLSTVGPVDIPVEAGATGADVVLTLAAAVSVRGVVIDVADQPVAGVTVAIGDFDQPYARESPTAVSQVDGSFSIDGVVPGGHSMTVTPGRLLEPNNRERVLVPPGGVNDLAVVVEPGVSVSGQVTRLGKPVDGVHVRIGSGSATTTVDGTFVVPRVPPGVFVVYTDSVEDGVSSRSPQLTVADADVTGVTVELERAASVSGKVVDQHGAPVSGVGVELWRGTVDSGFSMTQDDGTFEIRPLYGGGSYRVVIAGFKPAVGRELPPVTVADGTTHVTGLQYAVEVEHLAIAGSVVDERGAPVSDVHVTAQTNAGPGRGGDDTTGADGTFAITDLGAGRYRIYASASNGAEPTLDHEVDAGTRGLVVTLAAPGEIAGSLHGFSGPVRVDATVMALDGLRTGRTLGAEVHGDTFHLRGLIPGRYAVSAYRSGVVVDETDVEVVAGRTASAVLTDRDTSTVTGVVTVAANGALVPHASCHVARPGFPTIDVVTDPLGGFTIEPVAVGTAEIECWDDAGHVGRATVAVSAAAVATVAVQVTRPGPPDGTIGATFTDTTAGPRVATVVASGPAASAGIRVGDLVKSVDGVDGRSLDGDSLADSFSAMPPGTDVDLEIQRGTVTVEVTVTIVASP